LTARSGGAGDHGVAKPLPASLDAPCPGRVGALRFVLQVSCLLGGTPVARMPVIYPPRHGGMEGFGRSQTGSVKAATTPPVGGGS